MARRFSSLFGLTTEQFEAAGAFDGFVEVDSRLYVDPHLLEASAVSELKGARTTFEAHFEKVLKLLRQSKRPDDIFWVEARQLLTFKEVPQTALGHGKHDTSGSGIGPILANELTTVAKEIIDAGVADPEIFELVGLFQGNIGPDRLSDMVVATVLSHLLAYSARVAKQFHIDTIPMTRDGIDYRVPYDKETGKAVILVPRDVLKTIPVAHSWDDVDRIAAHNAELRKRVSKTIGETWKRATGRSVSKQRLRETLTANPELLRDLLSQYHNKPTRSYDFERDPDALLLWHSLALGDQPLPRPAALRLVTFLTHRKPRPGVGERGLLGLFFGAGSVRRQCGHISRWHDAALSLGRDRKSDPTSVGASVHGRCTATLASNYSIRGLSDGTRRVETVRAIGGRHNLTPCVALVGRESVCCVLASVRFPGVPMGCQGNAASARLAARPRHVDPTIVPDEQQS